MNAGCHQQLRRASCASGWTLRRRAVHPIPALSGPAGLPHSALRLCLHAQQTFLCSRSVHGRGAAAAIIVYDITSTDSFNRAKAWVRELQRQGGPNMIMALAGGRHQGCSRVAHAWAVAHKGVCADQNHLSWLRVLFGGQVGGGRWEAAVDGCL